MPRSKPVARILDPAELRAERERLALSQAEFASRLGVDVMTVSRWERGQRVPPAMLSLAVTALR